MERCAGDARLAAAAERGRGQLGCDLRGSSEKARSATGCRGWRRRRREQVEVEAGARASASPVSRAQSSAPLTDPASADLELGLLRRQVGEGAVRRPPARRRSAAGSAALGAPAARIAPTSAVPAVESSQLARSTRTPPSWRARTSSRNGGRRVGALEARAAAPGRPAARRRQSARPAAADSARDPGRRCRVAADAGSSPPSQERARQHDGRRDARRSRNCDRPPARDSPACAGPRESSIPVARSYSQPPMAAVDTVVMKFGGTSVAEPEDIKRAARRIVAARESGKQVVAVLSARGKTTDDLVAAAYEISERPLAREMDMLLSTGERISCALCAMAIHDMGHRAISLTGSQAGIVTDSSHTKARIIDVRADRIRAGARRGPDRPRRRLPGRLRRQPGRDHARPRRLGHDRGRDRRRARAPRSARSTPTSPASSAPTRGSSPTRASSPRSPSRRCSRCRPRAPGCCSCARSSTRATTASGSTAAARSRTAPVPSCSPRTRRWNDRWSQPSPTPTRRG